MSPSKILFFLSLSLIIGISLASFVKIPEVLLWVFLLVVCLSLTIAVALGNNRIITIAFCALFLLLGMLRFNVAAFEASNDTLRVLNGKGVVTISGVVTDGPDIRNASQKIKVKVANSVVLVTTTRYQEYHYLDNVTLTGKLEAPGKIDDFNYQDYLLKDHIYTLMNFPKISKVPSKDSYHIFSFLYNKILEAKGALQTQLLQNFVPPQSSLLLGILFGDTKTMTQSLKDELTVTGLRFLTAISGLHIILISSMIASMFLVLGLWRKHAFLLSVFFMWMYVVLTGSSSSGVRAGIMGSIFLFAQVVGRQHSSARALTFAASCILLENPFLLRYDVGFQLSFLASLGMIYLKPSLDIFLKRLFGAKILLLDLLSVTITAQVFTLPVMVYSFGIISFVAPITNLLIIPVVSWILLFGFLVSVGGSLWSVLGHIFAAPCLLLVNYFLSVAELFNQPWAAKTVSGISWLPIFISYIVIGLLTFALYKKFANAWWEQ